MRLRVGCALACVLMLAGCGRATAPAGSTAGGPQPAALADSAQAAAAPASVLGKLCSGLPEVAAGATHEGALAEITAAVRTSGADTGALKQVLADLAANKWADPAVLGADVDGDGAQDTIITFGWCQIPAIVYPGGGEARGPVVMPAADSLTWSAGGGGRVDRVADVNGDGRPELVVEYRLAGASSAHAFPYIYQWQGGQPVVLFHDHVISWVGPNQWTLGNGTVSIQCHVFGPYDHKMTPHQQQTETFRWNPATARYELAERTRTPIVTRLQQVGVAERLFQQGRYPEAAREYRQVSAVPASQQEGEAVDWAAYAHLRLGQIAALAGRRDEALAELAQA